MMLQFSSAGGSRRRDPNAINVAIVAAIEAPEIPHVDKENVSEIFGTEQGEMPAPRVLELVREAVSIPLEWGTPATDVTPA
jgi:hypothetical protein